MNMLRRGAIRLSAIALLVMSAGISPSSADPLATCTTVNDNRASIVVCPPEKVLNQDGQQVINGCGPHALMLGGADRRFMDSHIYRFDVSRGESVVWTVNFRDSCNLHDIGYEGKYIASFAGQWVRPLVYDKILNQYIDYSIVSRKWIDDHFLEDMRAQCDQQIRQDAMVRRQAGRDWRGWEKAIQYCQANGQGTAFGAVSMHKLVREFGHLFFSNDDARRVNDRTR